MSENTQLSSQVNSQTLDTMYNNFVKMTDWLINGKKSQFPMPQTYGNLFAGAELAHTHAELIAQLTNTINEQNKVISGLQQRLSETIAKADKAVATAQHLEKVVSTFAEQVAQAQATTDTPVQEVIANLPTEPAPAQPAPQQLPPLADLGAVEPAPVAPATPPADHVPVNHDTLQVTAEQVNAGDITPAGLQALDDEINNLLSV